MNEAFNAIDAAKNDAQDQNDDDDDGLIEMTDFYDPVAALLSSIGGEAENLTEELRKYGIKYEHLSGLCEEDLTLLGLKNKKIREEVLTEIAVLPNQVEHYDEALKTLKVREYIRDVLSNVSSHVDSLNALLTLTQLRISTQHVENVQVEDDKYASEVAVSVCRKLETKTNQLERLLEAIKQGRFSKESSLAPERKNSKTRSSLSKLLFVSLLLGGAYVGLRFFKPYFK